MGKFGVAPGRQKPLLGHGNLSCREYGRFAARSGLGFEPAVASSLPRVSMRAVPWPPCDKRRIALEAPNTVAVGAQYAPASDSRKLLLFNNMRAAGARSAD